MQIRIVHRGGMLYILLIVKLTPHADKALIECEFRISGQTQNAQNFETIQEKPTTNSISTECDKMQWSPACCLCGLCELFRYVCISLRIFLTIPATRSAMSQTPLADQARLSIDCSIAGQVDFDSFIRNFANKKARNALIQ